MIFSHASVPTLLTGRSIHTGPSFVTHAHARQRSSGEAVGCADAVNVRPRIVGLRRRASQALELARLSGVVCGLRCCRLCNVRAMPGTLRRVRHNSPLVSGNEARPATAGTTVKAVRNVAIVVVIVGALIALLTVVAVQTKSHWDTFYPDLIVAVAGAGSIGAIIAWVQHVSDSRRAERDRASAVYEGLVDHMSALIHLDLRKENAVLGVNELHRDMRRLAEAVDRQYPKLPNWFEAERQLGMFHLRKASDSLEILMEERSAEGEDPTLTSADNAEALTAYLRWLAEFTNNVRFWRTGSLSAKAMVKQTSTIETSLRARDEWTESMAWRDEA